MARTKDDVLREITTDYLDGIDMSNPPTPVKVQEEILDRTSNKFQLENTLRPKNSQWKIPQTLSPPQIADILLKLHRVVNIAYSGLDTSNEYDALSVYQTDGEYEGVYISDNRILNQLIRQYSYTITDSGVKETITLLKDKAERKARCDNRNLIAVNNGIFDYETKQLMGFTPDLVFTSKSKVNYNSNVQNITIHNDEDGTNWDVESWMDDLFDGNKNLSGLIWEIIGAIIRQNVSWNKSAWFYSESGNNGKGTLCELMRQIAGRGSYAAIPLSDFSKDFMLEPLINASAIIVDENAVGSYIDNAANLKAVITGDPIQINRKHKTPVAYQFKGFMVQCLNEMPKIKDRSESFYRRQLFVPFMKSFTGVERKYIKDDYLHRSEVLEYVLHKVLHTDYYELSNPDECNLTLQSYKEFNDPVREFLAEFMGQFAWDLLPYDFLYDLYKAWYKDNYGNQQNIKGKNTFIKDIKLIISAEYDGWTIASVAVRTASRMNASERLIAEYKLDRWYNPAYKGDDPEKIGHPDLKPAYKGVQRI